MMPDNAAHIWVEDTTVHLGLPGPDPRITPHFIKFPNDALGWAKIRDTIEHRKPASLIGTKGDPYQAQINKDNEALIKEYVRTGGVVSGKRTFTGEEIASALAVMRECGVL